MITAVCSPDCMNGGTCIEPGECTCAAGWTGNRCETGTQHFINEYVEFNYAECIHMITAVCSPDCMNGGICIELGVCTCVTGWTGNRCETGTQHFTSESRIEG